MTIAKLIILVFASFACLLVSEAKFYKDCGSTAEITFAHIGGCTTGRCGVVKGKTYNFGVDFLPKYNSTELPTKVSAKIFGVTKTLIEENACSELSAPCPITAGEIVKYSSRVTVPKSLPSISGTLKVSVKDENGHQVICGEVKFKIMK